MYEFAGKTYEEAVNKALQTLKVSIDDLIIEKISEKPNSILDILKEKQTGQVFIRVKLKKQEDAEYNKASIKNEKKLDVSGLPEYVVNSIDILKEITNLLEADVVFKISNTGEWTQKREPSEQKERLLSSDVGASGDFIIEIDGKDKGMLIGKHGNTLNAIQNYINFIINKSLPKDQRNYVIIDSDNYRERRKKQLIDLALKTAKTVQQKKEPITLEPMLAFERKIIHMTLKDNQYVTTYSIGENPYKSVVVAPLLGSSESFFS